MGDRGAQRREQLLLAALELFSERGYDRATTREIAESTGVTEAALFKYFPTKRDLFLEVLRRFGPAGHFAGAAERFGELPLTEALGAAIEQHLDLWWEHRQFGRILRQELERDDEAREELRSQFRAMRADLRALIERLAERGEIRPDAVEAASEVLLVALRGFIGRARRAGDESWESMRDDFTDSLVQVVVNGIAPAPRA